MVVENGSPAAAGKQAEGRPGDQITPVLLAGGSGTRLWPVSRKAFPKQFVPLLGGRTLFQASVERLSGPCYAPPIITTNADFRFIITDQLEAIGTAPAAVLIEPAPRNTAPAILAAALLVARHDPQALLLVAPSDHVVPDVASFSRAVEAGMAAARAGQIVTFGIQPTRPETGYGWLELDNVTPDGPALLRRFVEKPDPDRAAAMLAEGRYLWNAGIFLFSAATMIEAFRTHAPEYLEPVEAALAQSCADLDFTRLDAAPWADLPDRSIDYAVMEKADNLSVVPYDGHWSDLGGWDAVWREGGGANAPDGALTDTRSTAIDCQNVLLRSEADSVEVVAIGLSDTMVVATGDAVLVAPMDRAQEVRNAVAALKDKGAPQAEQFRHDHRPWGWFETLVHGDRFRVKRIVVKPGASLSLQSHMHRAEHWVVVSGTALVTIDGHETLMTENQSIYVPLGAVHRLENPGHLPAVVIEVQTGAYLGEDDITRFEDSYARG